MKYSLIANQLMRRILLLLLLFSLVETSGAAFPFSKRKKKTQSTQTERNRLTSVSHRAINGVGAW